MMRTSTRNLEQTLEHLRGLPVTDERDQSIATIEKALVQAKAEGWPQRDEYVRSTLPYREPDLTFEDFVRNIDKPSGLWAIETSTYLAAIEGRHLAQWSIDDARKRGEEPDPERARDAFECHLAALKEKRDYDGEGN